VTGDPTMIHVSLSKLARRRTKAFAIPLVLSLIVLVLIAAFSGNFQVSSHRRMFERLYARRLMAMAAESAFEEASAIIEGRNRGLPPLSLSLSRSGTALAATRNLRSLLWIPTEVSPDLTRRHLQDQGVTLGSVRLRSSDWVLKSERQASDSVSVQVQEIGILCLEVDVSVRAGSSTLQGAVSCRRYMDASPDQAGGSLTLHVLPRDMVLQVRHADAGL